MAHLTLQGFKHNKRIHLKSRFLKLQDAEMTIPIFHKKVHALLLGIHIAMIFLEGSLAKCLKLENKTLKPVDGYD